MATEDERNLFASEVLMPVGQDAARLPSSKVTGFLAMAGHCYDGALMVVGRAVNGWTKGVLPADLASYAVAECHSREVLKSVKGDASCPMRWVTRDWGNSKGYNTKRSAFWRVIRAVVERLDIADVDQDTWPSHLVWSNLYKVAPSEGGNPDGVLCEVQLPGCIKLFNLELATYTPSRLLLLTGNDWAAPFIPDLQERPGKYVKAAGTIAPGGGVKPIEYVVAVHPQGKPGTPWVDEVVGTFAK